MNRPVVIVFVLVLAACNPIPPHDPDRFVECTGYSSACNPGCTSMDAVDNLPRHINIIKTRSNRVGETIHARFYLREIPEMMTFNRDGVGDTVLEYMWTVSVDVDGRMEPWLGHEYDFMMAAFTKASVVSERGRNLVRPLENMIEVELYERVFDESLEAYTWVEVEGSNPRVTISREDQTIKLTSEIPGVSQESLLHFRSFDALLGEDCISPE
ncbi:MAG: hypothetical protein OXF54_04510 [Caldilineaceae bacterium]|nr:hypothetical protein [Caldilineaceae bacterium]